MNTMSKQHAHNLFLLAGHMEGRPEWLGMNRFHNCGTPSCAIGDAACMPEFISQGLRTIGDYGVSLGGNLCADHQQVGLKLFGLRGHEADRLFGWDSLNAWDRNNVTGPEWAAEALRVLAEHGYSSDPAMPAVKHCKAHEYGEPCRYPACDCGHLARTRTLCTQLVASAAGLMAETY